MTLTRRERLLLFLLVLVLAAAGVFHFAIRPLHAQLASEQARLETLSAERERLDGLLADGSLARAFRREAREAGRNYETFHSALNSYTVDRILNGLMEQNGLRVQNLQIAPYREAPEEELLPGSGRDSGGEQTESLLMLSEVDLLATGGYEDAKAFVDALNDESFCLRVERLQIDLDPDNPGGNDARVSATIRIYGVRPPEGADLS